MLRLLPAPPPFTEYASPEDFLPVPTGFVLPRPYARQVIDEIWVRCETCGVDNVRRFGWNGDVIGESFCLHMPLGPPVL